MDTTTRLPITAFTDMRRRWLGAKPPRPGEEPLPPGVLSSSRSNTLASESASSACAYCVETAAIASWEARRCATRC